MVDKQWHWLLCMLVNACADVAQPFYVQCTTDHHCPQQNEIRHIRRQGGGRRLCQPGKALTASACMLYRASVCPAVVLNGMLEYCAVLLLLCCSPRHAMLAECAGLHTDSRQKSACRYSWMDLLMWLWGPECVIWPLNCYVAPQMPSTFSNYFEGCVCSSIIAAS